MNDAEIRERLMAIARELVERGLRAKADADYNRYRTAIDKIYAAAEILK
jgi:hypothetical protein